MPSSPGYGEPRSRSDGLIERLVWLSGRIPRAQLLLLAPDDRPVFAHLACCRILAGFSDFSARGPFTTVPSHRRTKNQRLALGRSDFRTRCTFAELTNLQEFDIVWGGECFLLRTPEAFWFTRLYRKMANIWGFGVLWRMSGLAAGAPNQEMAEAGFSSVSGDRALLVNHAPYPASSF